MDTIMGECPQCKGKGYVTKYAGTSSFGPFGVFVPAAPRTILGLKTCFLCKGSKEVEVREI